MADAPYIHNPDGIIEDDISLAHKAKVMERLKGKNMYDAVSKVAMFAGTMLTTATAGVVLGKLFTGAVLSAALTTPVIATLALGAIAIGIAVATDYISSGIGQGASYDIQEATAHSAAREMAQALGENPTVSAAQSAQNTAIAQKNWAAQAEAEKLSQTQEMTPQR